MKVVSISVLWLDVCNLRESQGHIFSHSCSNISFLKYIKVPCISKIFFWLFDLWLILPYNIYLTCQCPLFLVHYLDSLKVYLIETYEYRVRSLFFTVCFSLEVLLFKIPINTIAITEKIMIHIDAIIFLYIFQLKCSLKCSWNSWEAINVY